MRTRIMINTGFNQDFFVCLFVFGLFLVREGIGVLIVDLLLAAEKHGLRAYMVNISSSTWRMDCPMINSRSPSSWRKSEAGVFLKNDNEATTIHIHYSTA